MGKKLPVPDHSHLSESDCILNCISDYEEDLLKKIDKESNGAFEEIFTAIYSDKREEDGTVDNVAAQKDAMVRQSFLLPHETVRKCLIATTPLLSTTGTAKLSRRQGERHLPDAPGPPDQPQALQAGLGR